MTVSLETESDRVAAQERRRRRTWRRGWMLVGACVLTLVTLRIAWGVIAQRRWDAVIQRLRDAGEPLTFDELRRTKDVPDERNAALLYEKAAELISVPAAFAQGTHLKLQKFTHEWRTIPLFPDDARQIVEANHEVLNLLHQARDMHEIDWGNRFDVNEASSIDRLFIIRELHRFGGACAIARELEGDHADCIETLRDLHAMNVRIVDSSETNRLYDLIAMGCENELSRAISVIAPTLELEDARVLLPQAHQPALREQVKALIRDLLVDDSWQEAWLWSMNVTRVHSIRETESRSVFHGAPGVLVDQAKARLAKLVFGPSVLGDGVELIPRITDARNSGLRPYSVAAERLTPGQQDGANDWELSDVAHPYRFFWLFQRDTPVDSDYFINHLFRRFAATALAMRLYELDHGIRPMELDDLVPEYLDAVPRDPFSADGRAVGFLRDVPKPILFSVGENGTDEHGAYDFAHTVLMSLDIPFFLDGDWPNQHPLDMERLTTGSAK